MKPIILLATLGITAVSQAAIVTSGLRDIVVSNTFGGIYLDVDAGTTSSSETVGWDINPFFGGEGVASSPAFHPVTATVVFDAPILNLGFGTAVDSSSTFGSGSTGSDSHIGNSPNQFVSGSEGYVGFQFLPNGGSTPLYGWMKLVLSNTSSPGLIREWAYEDSGAPIAVGAVPEPSTAILILLTSASCFLRRRK